MKKLAVLLVAAASLLFAANAHAQFGIIGGLTSSNANMKTVDDVKAVNLYHAGLTYKFDLGLGFAIQPSVLYQVKGAKTGDLKQENSLDSFELKTGFIEIPVGFQWGPDLVAFRPYLFAEPFIGYAITAADKYDGTVKEAAKTWADNARNKMEYGFGLGAGVEIARHFPVSAQYFSNLGKVFKGEEGSSSVQSLKDVKFQGVKVSLAILF